MNERFTSDLAFILFVLIIAALLGFLIGYLCRRIRRNRFLILENENEQLRIKLDACKQQKEKQVRLFDADAAREAFNMKIIENDLKIVEGIGEKIDSILRNKGITTWYQLSQTSPERIKDILLTDGGPNYKIHEPKTWPTQALLAYEGQWKQLKEYQDQLIGGR
jgi:predicted flap endonuclease-1-like 5' DNA nuclease